MQKHKRQYFEGSLQRHLTNSALSLYQTTNKQLAKQLGISERTLYNIKAGKNTSRETKDKYKTFLKKLGDDGLKVGALAEHLKRTGKKKISKQAAEKVISKKKEKLGLVAQMLSENPNLIYAVLFYGKQLETEEE